MAGYVLSNETAVRLSLVLDGIDPDRVTPPPPGCEILSNIVLIEKEIKKYMGAKKLKVTARLTGTEEHLETILVTQSFLLDKPHELGGRLPVTTEGRLDGLVLQWLENNGNLLFL